MTLIAVLWAVFRLHGLETPELVARLERPPRRRRTAPRSVSPAVALLRLLTGFAAPMRENAVLAAALHRCGVPVRLVVGAEPVPGPQGEHRVYTWLEVAGAPLDAGSPPDTYLVEMATFPKADSAPPEKRAKNGKA